jgi:hypothetical protein
MNRFSWTALGMALMMLAACNASAPNEASEGGAAAEGEEHGEHEEAPLETKIAAKLRRRRVSRSHRQAPVRLLTSMRCRAVDPD